MARSQRSARTSLGQVVLGFELIIVGLAALVFMGLKALPMWVALGGGAAVCALMVLTIVLMMKYRWAYALGWAVQAIVILSGFVVTTMFIIGIIFTAIWTYAMVMGQRLDSQKGSNE